MDAKLNTNSTMKASETTTTQVVDSPPTTTETSTLPKKGEDETTVATDGAVADDDATNPLDDTTAPETDALDDDTNKETDNADQEEDESNIAPLHLRIPTRVRGNSSVRSRSSSRSNSREVSPNPPGMYDRTKSASSSVTSPKLGGGLIASDVMVPGTIGVPPPPPLAATLPGTEAGSSAASSLAGDGSDIDPDILLDKMGYEDLVPPPPREIATGPLANWGHSSLPSVNERLSEETLDDVHAFTDLVATLNNSFPESSGTRGSGTGSVGGISGGGSVGGDASCFLETLEEEDDGDDGVDEEDPEEVKKRKIALKKKYAEVARVNSSKSLTEVESSLASFSVTHNFPQRRPKIES